MGNKAKTKGELSLRETLFYSGAVREAGGKGKALDQTDGAPIRYRGSRDVLRAGDDKHGWSGNLCISYI